MQTPAKSSLHGLSVAVAGPGRVGSSFGRWALDRGASLLWTVTRTPMSEARCELLGRPQCFGFDDFAARLASADGIPVAGTPVAGTPVVDVLLLTTSDASLAELAGRWAETLSEGSAEGSTQGSREAPMSVVLHAAGSLDAEVLAPLRTVGVAVGSLHPLRAFSGVLEEPEERGVYAVDGDVAAQVVARRLVSAWGGVAYELAGERRLAYHLAASLAAGGVVTVLAAVARLMQCADLPDDLLDGYLRLLHGAVAPVVRPADAAPSITGPAARGDADTLAAHLRALRGVAPELEPLVSELWRATEMLTKGRPAGGS